MVQPWFLHWLRGAGFDVRPWDATRWWIMHPATTATSVLTVAELRTLVRCLERDFHAVVVAADATQHYN